MSDALVLAAEPWAVALFDATLRHLPLLEHGRWFLITTARELDDKLSYPDLHVRQAFVLHWHDLIPRRSLLGRRFVGFHASNLPSFRGGAPIRNQQARGVFDTQLTAFELDAGIDTGPILLKLPLSLRGTDGEIFERIVGLIARMMPRLLYDDALVATAQPPGGSFYTRRDAEMVR